MKISNLLAIALLLTIVSCSHNVSITIVQNNDQKVEGKTTKIREDIYSLTQMKYWDSLNVKHRINPFEVKSFSLQGYDFESVQLNVRTNMEHGKNAFLRRVIDGAMILYVVENFHMGLTIRGQARSKCREYYYIKKQTDSIAHLIYEGACDTEIFPSIILQTSDYNDFLAYFSDCPALYQKIKDGTYKRKHVFDIVDEYNGLMKVTKP